MSDGKWFTPKEIDDICCQATEKIKVQDKRIAELEEEVNQYKNMVDELNEYPD